MGSTATHEDIARLLMTFNIEIGSLPDGLKCGKCKSVLKNASQLPCGCRFCRTCIDDLMAIGAHFCPGGSQECSSTPLSTDYRDFSANKSISRLTGKCPLLGCSHECSLADMVSHLRECPKKNVNCPFREFGCRQDKLTTEEMSGHLQKESRSHSEILIAVVTNTNRDMELLKGEMVLKDEQVRHLENEIKAVNDENKSIKDQIEAIKWDKIVLNDRLRQLSEKLQPEIDERDCARETEVTKVIGSNRQWLGTEMEPLKEDIRSIKCDMDSLKWQVQSALVVMGLGRGDASCDEWLIAVDVSKTRWGWDSAMKTSDKFRGATRPLTYQVASNNNTGMGELHIWLRIWAGPGDSLLEWPFSGAVTVTVAHRDRREICSRQTRQCRIERPPDNRYRESKEFIFEHSSMRKAGLDLERGVRVSCQVMPGEGQ